MSYNIDRQTKKSSRVRRLLLAALALGCALATVAPAQAQNFTSPKTPDLITPPEGNSAYLVGHAKGTQGYVCLPKDGGQSWTTARGARPEATLFQSFFGLEVQIITHFLSPNTNPNEAATILPPFGVATWQGSLDSSKVWAQVPRKDGILTSIPAGSDPTSCPNTGSIACLLLQAVGSQAGPTGGTFLSQTTFIQRLNTKGGSAPDDADGCASSADVGSQKLVPYTADYYFFRKVR